VSALETVRPVTLKMVAKAAKVSTAAVSYVMRGRAREMSIGAACEKRIRTAARRLGYLGNYHAQSLALKSSRSIGMAVAASSLSFLHSPFFSSLVSGCEQQIRMKGYGLHMIGSPQIDEILPLAYDNLMARRVDGLIVFPFLHLSIPKQLMKPGLPVVFVEGQLKGNVATIGLDPAPGIDASMRHLYDLGHRTVTWIGMRGEHTPIMGERIIRFRTMALELGIKLEEVLLTGLTGQEDVSMREMLGAIYRVLSKEAHISLQSTAIICENDSFGLAMLKVLTDRGMRVPEDISLIGFDDIYALMTLPAMTTISHRLIDIGRGAVNMILDIVEGRAGKKAAHIQVPSELIIRDSTGPVRSVEL